MGILNKVLSFHGIFRISPDSSDRIIDTHIKNIRAKLGPSGMDWIETVRGYGYRFLGHDALV